MFLRITKQKNRKGKEVLYAALAESKRVKGKKYPQTVIVQNLGRMDENLYSTLVRLERSLTNGIDRYEQYAGIAK